MKDGYADGDERPWAALSHLVRARRDESGLRQSDLEALGGPSEYTVRDMERGVRTDYRSRTIECLERSLRFPLGTITAVLDGSLSTEEALARYVDGGRGEVAAQEIERREVDAHRLGRWAGRLTVAALAMDMAGVAHVINEMRDEATALRRSPGGGDS